jgi:hypothetical protein
MELMISSKRTALASYTIVARAMGKETAIRSTPISREIDDSIVTVHAAHVMPSMWTLVAVSEGVPLVALTLI